MATGTQDYVGDPRNDDVLISVDGALVHRDKAVVSVFDSGFVLGDGVWEGLRLIDGRLAFLDAHLDRLYDGAKMLMIDIGLDRAALVARLFDCLDAQRHDGRRPHPPDGDARPKRSPYQDPRLTVGAATIVIIPEWKLPRPEMYAKGISLFTVHVRRTGPADQDPKLNSHSKLNDILACIQAMNAGADEALMLDDRGFVATCNSTHFFIVRDGEVWTSGGGFCLRGITRDAVLRAARRGRHPGLRAGLLAVRRLCGRRGLRDRHLRGPDPGRGGRRAHAAGARRRERRLRARSPGACATLYLDAAGRGCARAGSAPMSAPRIPCPHRHVVRARATSRPR